MKAVLSVIALSIGGCRCVPPEQPAPVLTLPLPSLPADWDFPATGMVLGTAADSATQLPLGGAEVWIRPSGLPDVAGSNDGEAKIVPFGGFRFERLPPGEHTLFVRMLGWNLCEVTIMIAPHEVDTVRLVLVQPASIVIHGEQPAYPKDYCLRSNTAKRSGPAR